MYQTPLDRDHQDREPQDRDPPGQRPPWTQDPLTETETPLWTDKHLWKHNLRKLRLRAVINTRDMPDNTSSRCSTRDDSKYKILWSKQSIIPRLKAEANYCPEHNQRSTIVPILPNRDILIIKEALWEPHVISIMATMGYVGWGTKSKYLRFVSKCGNNPTHIYKINNL